MKSLFLDFVDSVKFLIEGDPVLAYAYIFFMGMAMLLIIFFVLKIVYYRIDILRNRHIKMVLQMKIQIMEWQDQVDLAKMLMSLKNDEESLSLLDVPEENLKKAKEFLQEIKSDQSEVSKGRYITEFFPQLQMAQVVDGITNLEKTWKFNLFCPAEYQEKCRHLLFRIKLLKLKIMGFR